MADLYCSVHKLHGSPLGNGVLKSRTRGVRSASDHATGQPFGTTMPYRTLSARRCLVASVGPDIQDKLNGGPQKVGAVSLGHEGIDRPQRSLRQFQLFGKHDDGELRHGFLDLRRED